MKRTQGNENLSAKREDTGTSDSDSSSCSSYKSGSPVPCFHSDLQPDEQHESLQYSSRQGIGNTLKWQLSRLHVSSSGQTIDSNELSASSSDDSSSASSFVSGSPIQCFYADATEDVSPETGTSDSDSSSCSSYKSGSPVPCFHSDLQPDEQHESLQYSSRQGIGNTLKWQLSRLHVSSSGQTIDSNELSASSSDDSSSASSFVSGSPIQCFYADATEDVSPETVVQHSDTDSESSSVVLVTGARSEHEDEVTLGKESLHMGALEFKPTRQEPWSTSLEETMDTSMKVGKQEHDLDKGYDYDEKSPDDPVVQHSDTNSESSSVVLVTGVRSEHEDEVTLGMESLHMERVDSADEKSFELRTKGVFRPVTKQIGNSIADLKHYYERSHTGGVIVVPSDVPPHISDVKEAILCHLNNPDSFFFKKNILTDDDVGKLETSTERLLVLMDSLALAMAFEVKSRPCNVICDVLLAVCNQPVFVFTLVDGASEDDHLRKYNNSVARGVTGKLKLFMDGLICVVHGVCSKSDIEDKDLFYKTLKEHARISSNCIPEKTFETSLPKFNSILTAFWAGVAETNSVTTDHENKDEDVKHFLTKDQCVLLLENINKREVTVQHKPRSGASVLMLEVARRFSSYEITFACSSYEEKERLSSVYPNTQLYNDVSTFVSEAVRKRQRIWKFVQHSDTDSESSSVVLVTGARSEHEDEVTLGKESLHMGALESKPTRQEPWSTSLEGTMDTSMKVGKQEHDLDKGYDDDEKSPDDSVVQHSDTNSESSSVVLVTGVRSEHEDEVTLGMESLHMERVDSADEKYFQLRTKGVFRPATKQIGNSIADIKHYYERSHTDVDQSQPKMASSNDHEGNDDVPSGEITLPSDQLAVDPNIAAGINALAIHSDVNQSQPKMASSNDHEGNDDVPSGEITLPSDQLAVDPNIAAGINDVDQSQPKMASSNDHEGNDDVPSGEITLPSDQLAVDPNIAAGINGLAIHSDHLEVTSNTFQTSAGATRQGTLDSKTLKLKLTDAQNTFVPTKSFEDIRRCLEQNCHVTICGASGEGKTTMALMLGQEYRKQGYELVFVDRPEVFDLGPCISSGQKLCLIFDDIFGADGQSPQVTTVKNLCNALKLHIDKNLQTRQNAKTKKKLGPEHAELDDKKHLQKTQVSNEIRVIFTSKTYNFHDGISKCQYQHISMFTKKTVKELTVNPESPYSREEKRKMFEKHKEMHRNKQLGDLEVEEVIKQDSTLFGFPLTCRLFFEFYRPDKATAVDFFRRPAYYLRIELNDILSRTNEQAAALILVLLCEGNIKLPDLETKNKNEKVDEMLTHVSSFTNSASRSSIARAARSFRGTFLSRGDNLSFAHSSIYDAFACALYQFNPSLVLEFCSLEFLYERLKPLQVQETGVSDTLHYLFVSEEYFPEVITRFVSSMKEGIFSKTVAHPIMQNEKFVKKFLEDINKLASDNKTWIKRKDTGKCFLYWVVKSKGTYLVENIGTFLQVTFTDDDIREALLAAVECDNLTHFKLLMGKLNGKLCKIDVNNNLLSSAKSSGEEMVKCFLEMGADVSFADRSGRTFLHFLCVFDRPLILELVASLSNKENVRLAIEKFDNDGNTPLMLAALHGTWNCFKFIKNEIKTSLKESENLIHLACKGGNMEIVKSVLTHRDNLNNRNQYGRTPTMQAAFDSKPDVFDLLLSKRADVTLVDDDGNTLLHYACFGGNTHIVERILTPQNINSRGPNERTPIMVAALEAKPDVYDLLLSHKADVTLVDEKGNTLLHYACIGGNTHIVERILTPQNINSRGFHEWTPIMDAAKEAKPDVFDLLLSHKADVTLVDDDGDTLLHIACSGGNTHIVERILTPQNINSRGWHELTPIMDAAREAKPDVFDLLLSKRADVTLVDDDGDTLLHIACIGGNKHIVERILTPQNINSRGWHELTPIMDAAREAKPDVFDLLLSHKADVTLVDEDGHTLLHHAFIGGNTHIVERILTPQNINSRGFHERTPIMDAAQEAKPDVFDLLLSHKADVTLFDGDGYTLLHHACIGGNTQIVKSVLTPQNINSKGIERSTPVMFAAQEGHINIVDYLCEKGADLTCLTSNGRDVVAVAEDADHEEVVKVLKNRLN